jgi:hypothetical protein
LATCNGSRLEQPPQTVADDAPAVGEPARQATSVRQEVGERQRHDAGDLQDGADRRVPKG